MKFPTTHPLFNTWYLMIRRCTVESAPNYQYYGGRGITVCDRWLHSFDSFIEDMGERPDGCSLDRIDNALGYSLDNCRWATPLEQAANRRAYSRPKSRASHHRTDAVANNPMRYIRQQRPPNGRWSVCMHINRSRHERTFDTLQEAIDYRSELEFEREMHKRLGL